MAADKQYPELKPHAAGITLRLRVQPRAAKNEFGEVWEGALKLRITAPPIDGAANRSCIALLAGALRIAKSRLEIVQGHTGRNKVVLIKGLTAEAALEKLRAGGVIP